jgi:MFS family permease
MVTFFPMTDSETASPYQILQNRNFQFYLTGRFIASFGQQMLTVAIGWELYERTNSALALGLVGLTQILPQILLTLPAGHVADNYSRKLIIQWTQTVIALCALGLGLVSWQQAPVPWTYGLLFISGVARSFLWPASSAFLVQIVSRDQFSKAMTWSSGSFQLSCVLGPAAGGFLIALNHHAAPVFFLDSLACLLCVVFVSFVRITQTAPARQKMSLESLIGGLRFVLKTRVILGAMTLDMFSVLLGGATTLLPIYARDILHVGPEGLGWLQAALPVGSLATALVLAHRPPVQKAGRALLWTIVGFGVSTIVFGLSQNYALSLGAMFLCGAFDNVNVVIRHTIVQVLTPDEMRGRVSAINSLFIGTSNELGGFESGSVAHLFGPVFSVVFGGLGTIAVVMGVAWLWPEIRNYGRLDTE